MKKLSIETIKEISKNSENFMDYFINLYKYAVDNFDKVQEIKGFPAISIQTFNTIVNNLPDNSIIEFNMLWLNQGFSTQPDLKDYYIYKNGVEVIYYK